MEKIYGYKEKDIRGLVEFLQDRKNGSLTGLFDEYARRNGKSQGTVRNLYYALAKKSREDGEFCKKYLDGKPLSVAKIKEFDERDEIELIRKVVSGGMEGKSVRKTIFEFSGGDATLALRYQNKYRNLAKTKPELVNRVEQEFSLSEKEVVKRKVEPVDKGFLIIKLKREINGLVDRIGEGLKRENQRLKKRIAILETENVRLFRLLADKNKNEKLGDFSTL